MLSLLAPLRARRAYRLLPANGRTSALLSMSVLICMFACDVTSAAKQPQQELHHYMVVVDWEANPTRQDCEQAPGEYLKLLRAYTTVVL